MTREDLKDIITQVAKKMQDVAQPETPLTACLFGDENSCDTCDITTEYAIGEEG